MAWNQPGGSNDKDPWTGKPKQSGPPDLEAFLRNLKRKITAFLNKNKSAMGGGSASGGGGDAETPGFQFNSTIVGLIVLGLLIIWFFAGIFIVDPAEQAVILRFGKYVTTVGPGPHWIPEFIDAEYPVNEQYISTYSYTAPQMLTKDENIVSVSIAVQYRVSNARDYLFNVVNPVQTLQQATASVLRSVIGQTNLDQVLTTGREQIRSQAQTQLTQVLQKYHTGLIVTDVTMQPAKAPDEVKEAFDDAIRAREDAQRFENQAQSYAMQVVPYAQGQAQRLLADANAYQQQVVLNAQADVAQYLALLPAYQKDPAVMRERMYLETMQNVLSNTNKVFIDSNSNNNMFYLPLDKLTSMPMKPISTNSISVPMNNTTSTPTDTSNNTSTTSDDDSSSSASSSSSYGSTIPGGY